MPIGGFSYQPAEQMATGGQSQSVSPQEAVRILSLRLPKRTPNAPVPSQLLNAPAGGGVGDLTQFIRMLMQAAGTKEQVGAGGPGIDTGVVNQTPIQGDTARLRAPHITIGDEGDRRRLDEGGIPDPTGGTPLFDTGRGARMGFRGGTPLF
jgi:hypothetical protein